MIFKLEKDLVSELVELLKKDHNIKYVTRELRNGNNIADVVFSEDISRNYAIFEEYIQSYYYVNKILNKKRIKIDDLQIDSLTIQKEFKKFLKFLEKEGYINIKGNNIEVIKKVKFATKNIVAIEAKLSDWKAGLEQALSYKVYSDYVYVAIEKTFYKNVDLEQFKLNNVGLILVEKGKMRKVFTPKKEKNSQLEIKYYMLDKFISSLGREQTING
ncbi:MAG TPA: hypothetical protein GX708_07170 [Gallicola sp.]|nr:hypothetical protein [Gallicola sp.]